MKTLAHHPALLLVLLCLLVSVEAQAASFLPCQPTPAESQTTEAAIRNLDRLITRQPDQVIYRLWRARNLIFLGRLDQAQSVFKQISALDPNCLEAWLGPLICEEYQGTLDSLQGNLEQAIRSGNSEPALRFRLALIHLLNTNYREAIPLLEQVTTACPDWVPAWYALAEAQAQVGESERADLAYARALQMRPTDPGIWISRGRHYYHIGHLVKAENNLRRALKIRPHSALAEFHLGLVQAARGQERQAAKTFGRSLLFVEEEAELIPFAGDSLILKGRILDRLGREEDSWNAFRMAWRCGDGRERAGAAIQMAFSLEGQPPPVQETLAMLSQVCSQDICLDAALLARGLLYRQIGDQERARHDLDQALSLAPPGRQNEARFYIALLLTDSGHYQEAALALQPALEAKPDFLVTLLKGIILHNQGKFDQAQTWLARATSIDQEQGFGLPVGASSDRFPPPDFSPELRFNYLPPPIAIPALILGLSATMFMYLTVFGDSRRGPPAPAPSPVVESKKSTRAIRYTIMAILLVLAGLSAFQAWRMQGKFEIGNQGVVMTRATRVVLAAPWNEVMALYALPRSTLRFDALNYRNWVYPFMVRSRRPMYYLITSRGSVRFSSEFAGAQRMAAEICADADLGKSLWGSWSRGYETR